MTTDPIAAARALIADAIDFACAANHHLAGQAPEQAQQWRDALATLTEALAQVAAAYEAATELVALDHVCDAIRGLTPADAQAALDKLLAEARLEGWRAGRDAAAQEAEDWFYDPHADEVTDYRLSLNIRMMSEPQEASHG